MKEMIESLAECKEELDKYLDSIRKSDLSKEQKATEMVAAITAGIATLCVGLENQAVSLAIQEYIQLRGKCEVLNEEMEIRFESGEFDEALKHEQAKEEAKKPSGKLEGLLDPQKEKI